MKNYAKKMEENKITEIWHNRMLQNEREGVKSHEDHKK
jgi:hypothetical protein